MAHGIAVLDFGSQVTQLIARRFREMGVYSEIFPYNVSVERLKESNPTGIVLSGGPSSVYDKDSPIRNVQELIDIAPVLGICYGMQLIAHELGGVVEASKVKEYGHSLIRWNHVLADVPKDQQVWMSHGDIVKVPPIGFQVAAVSERGLVAALKSDRVWALQFHPEVSHTEHGTELLQAFAFDLCKSERTWSMKNMVPHIIEAIQTKIPKEEKVLCALSGGVDSTVVGTLLTKALGKERVHCVFVNNGLLRKNEYDQVIEIYKRLDLNVHGVDAENLFLTKLAGVEDPEKKRKIIGHAFLEVFETAIRDIETKDHVQGLKWLAQGTLYPDVIESVNLRGSSVTIKTHHNVGGLPEKMNLKLVEPLREFFKDEVREIGRELGIPHDILWRHPFPGPGLAIRVIGAVDKHNLDVVRNADDVFISELKSSGLYNKIWQAFCVLMPVKTVGVQGDNRTYAKSLALRAITSQDGMTADWYEFSPDFLKRVSNRITNEVHEVNRVVYDITSKPPGTIEWE